MSGTRIAASNRQMQALELANVQLAEQRSELDRVSSALDAQEFVNEQRRLAQEFGIPPYIVEMARPLLEGHGHVVELTGGDVVDAGAIMRRVLVELGKQVKILDLGGLIGSSADPDAEEAEAKRQQTEQETRDFVKSARERFGL